MDKNVIAIGYAIAAVEFYALNVPCSKMQLAHISPVFMAGLLYIGAGLGIGIKAPRFRGSLFDDMSVYFTKTARSLCASSPSTKRIPPTLWYSNPENCCNCSAANSWSCE